jgi:AraC-like DNA-binding protein
VLKPLYEFFGERILAKIALELKKALAEKAQTGSSGQATARVLAKGKGWEVADVLCTSGPQDRKFEEQHSQVSIAIVASGTFQYRTSLKTRASQQELMVPGSLLLGNAGHCFECGHEHGEGDRCISFHYTSEYFEELAAGIRLSSRALEFTVPRLPPNRGTSALVARASTGLCQPDLVDWEALSVEVAGASLELANGLTSESRRVSAQTEARISKVLRAMEDRLSEPLSLEDLAAETGLSRYHFLRVFRSLTGLTPHQYLIRFRLREAAVRVTTEEARVIDVAMDSGFEDISNFNRNFRDEFGCSPRAYYRRGRMNSTVSDSIGLFQVTVGYEL